MSDAPKIQLLARRPECHSADRPGYYRYAIQVDGCMIWLTPKMYRYLLIMAAANGRAVSHRALEPDNPDKAVAYLCRLRQQISIGLGTPWPPRPGTTYWPVWERVGYGCVKLLAESVDVEPGAAETVPDWAPEINKLVGQLTGGVR